MPLGRHSIHIYSLGRGFDIAKKRNGCTVSSSEPKQTRMKYSKEGSRVFVPYQYDEMTIENIKEVLFPVKTAFKIF